MTPEELVQKCVKSIEFSKTTGISPTVTVTVVGHGKGRRRFPFGMIGPGAVIVGTNEHNDICQFDAHKLLDYLKLAGVTIPGDSA